MIHLQLLGFENFASNEFDLHLNATESEKYLKQFRDVSEAADVADNSILLKVAVGSFVYIAIYIAQRLWNFLIHERFIDNCLQQFVDVSSIANISVLILLNSYGFYVHGRSGNCLLASSLSSDIPLSKQFMDAVTRTHST